MARADLHFHTRHSDGNLDIYELASLLKNPRYQDIRTLAKTDHDTLLGTEEFAGLIAEQHPDRRVIAGTELTSMNDLPHAGSVTMHTLVYFHTEHGFDITGFSRAQRQEFYHAIVEDYLPIINSCVDSNNQRRLEKTLARTNGFLFGGERVVTPEEVRKEAESRAARCLQDASMINTRNSLVAVSDADIRAVAHRHGAGDSPAALRKHFTRTGECYASGYSAGHAVKYREVLESIRDASDASPVKTVVSQAHPMTYVRIIARAISARQGIKQKQVYDENKISMANLFMRQMLSDLLNQGLVQAVEAEYPKYRIGKEDLPEGAGNEDIAEMQSLEDRFSDDQRLYWTAVARVSGFRITGGSDSHFRDPELGYGFGDLHFSDDRVDEIFCSRSRG